MKAIRRFLSPSDAYRDERERQRVPRARSSLFSLSSQAHARTASHPGSVMSTPSAYSDIAPSQASSTSFNSKTRSVSMTLPSISARSTSMSTSRSMSISKMPQSLSSRSLSRRGRPARPRVVIDAADHPRLIVAIMKNAQRPVLLKLRTLSKSFRAMADAQLAQHIIVAAPVGIAYLRVTAPGERRSMAIDEASASSPSPAEDGVPGMSARVLWNRDERRGLSRVLAGVKVLDIRGPARAREQDMGDIARQCRCAHTVRLRPDAAGLPPLHVPLPQSVTRLVAFTSLAADGDRAGAAGRSVSAGDSMSKAARRASWRGIAAARESTNVQAGETAYIGQVPGRVRDIVVTVRYPRAGAIRSLAPWDHPTSLESVTVIFVGSSGRRKARPRSFLIGSSGSAADASGSTPIWEQHARQSQSKRLSWLSASGISLFSSPSNTPTATPTKGSFPDFGPIDPAFPAVPAPIPEGVTSLSSLNSPGLGSPGTPGSPQSPVPQTPTTPQTPSFLFSPPDAHDPLGSLTLFVRSVASHLPRVTYTLVDAGRIEPTLLGLAQGTLLSPRQIERLLRRAVATELGRSGWDEEETEFLLENLKFMSTASYKAKVGDSAFALHTIE